MTEKLFTGTLILNKTKPKVFNEVVRVAVELGIFDKPERQRQGNNIFEEQHVPL